MSSLLFALDGFKARPTIDIDLLGERISNDGVHRTVMVRRDSVTRFFSVFTCQTYNPKSVIKFWGYYFISFSNLNSPSSF